MISGRPLPDAGLLWCLLFCALPPDLQSERHQLDWRGKVGATSPPERLLQRSMTSLK
jgi:hypothetical protein